MQEGVNLTLSGKLEKIILVLSHINMYIGIEGNEKTLSKLSELLKI